METNASNTTSTGTNGWKAAKRVGEPSQIPVTYKVTWRNRAGEHHEEEFTNIDHGYDRYNYLVKVTWASAVTWEHVRH